MCVVARWGRLVGTAILVSLGFLFFDMVLARGARLVSAPRSEHPLRVRSLIYHHDLRPGVSLRELSPEVPLEWNPVVTTNSLGFRDRTTREVPLRGAKRRLLVLGDSFAEGLRVSYEETLAGRLSDRLGSHGMEVLNAAVCSYSPAIYYRKAKFLLETVKLHFDEVLVLIDLSDAEDETLYRFDAQGNVVDAISREESLLRMNHEYGTFGRLLIGQSFILGNLFRVVSEGMLSKRTPFAIGKHRALWTVTPSYYQEFARLGLEKGAENMSRLKALLDAHSIRLTVAVYPWPDQIYLKDRDSLQVRYWKNWAASHEARFVDLFGLFMDGSSPEATLLKYYFRGDVHWNSEGHRKVAEGLAPYFGQAPLSNKRAARQVGRASDDSTATR